MKIEDALTTLRILLSPAVAALIIAGKPESALYLYVVAAVTDIFDGYFARKHEIKGNSGDIFDSLADLTLVYFAVFALIIVNRWMWLFVLVIISTAVTTYVVGVISMKNGEFSIPHLNSAKVLAFFVHPAIMAYIVNWRHADTLLLATLVVGAFTAFEYVVYGMKCRKK